MKIGSFFLVVVFVLHGCAHIMRPPRYAISADTNQLLKQFRGKKASLKELDSPASYDSTCRLGAIIEAADGLTIPQFVTKAFNDELKLADLYDDSAGVKIFGSMDRIVFSSTSGWWDLALTLRSEKGIKYSVENRYEFPTMYDGITACDRTAEALGAATQDLLKKAVAHPEFSTLLQQ